MGAIDLKTLVPRESQILVKGETYTLGKFSLAVRIWAADEFATDKTKQDGLFILSQAIQDFNANTIAKLAYKLLKDKNDFPTLDSFINAFGNEYNIISALLDPIAKSIGVAEPEVNAEVIELKK